MKNSVILIIILAVTCVSAGTAHASASKITPELQIRAVINTVEKGPIEAVWQKGGEDVTEKGDRVIWGYFFASPDDVKWGNPENPDLFVKILFDNIGHADINYFHMSVPDIEVYSDYPSDGTPDMHDTTTMFRRYIRHYYKDGNVFMYENYEDGNPPLGDKYMPEENPRGYPTRTGIFIGAAVDSPEKGRMNAAWHKGGEDTTETGDKITWGYFYADPDDLSQAKENDPDVFVKIRLGQDGKADVNFFHASSAPAVELYSDIPFDDVFVQKGMAVPSNRYIRHEYQTNCSLEEKKKFIYDVMNDAYLWNDKIPYVDYTDYSSPEELFENLLYKDADRWSYITSTDEYYSYLEDGRYLGIGVSYQYDSNNDLRVRFVYKDSPADIAGLKRSDRILEINGKTIKEIEENNLWDTVAGQNEAGVPVNIKIEDSEGLIREITIEKDWVSMNTILYYDLLEANGLKIGYLVFNNFLEISREELDEVFAFFKSSQIDDLILDLRYNEGGRLSIAKHLASLIAGSNVRKEVFVKYMHNDLYREWDGEHKFTGPENALNLSRIIFIATESTCSASELVINSLKPFIETVIVGDTTCGKPVGMYGWDCCGIHLSPVEFKVSNADDESDYFVGIPPTCYSDDDLTRMFGDIQEESLKQALNYILNGSCLEERYTASLAEKQRKKIRLYGFRGEIGAF